MTPDRIREVVARAMLGLAEAFACVADWEEQPKRVRDNYLRDAEKILAALDAAGLEIVEKK